MSRNFDLNTSEQAVDLSILTANLISLMDARSVDSASLSSQTGIGITTINKLKRGIGNPTYSTLVTLSEFFNVSVSDLTELNLSGHERKMDRHSNIPLLALSDFKDYLYKNKQVRESISVTIDSNTDKCYAIKITTNSMSPFFEKGSVFVLDAVIKPQDGDLVLVEFGEHALCFRKVFIEGGAFFFKPITDHLGEVIPRNDNFIIHGVVITAIQNFHIG